MNIRIASLAFAAAIIGAAPAKSEPGAAVAPRPSDEICHQFASFASNAAKARSTNASIVDEIDKVRADGNGLPPVIEDLYVTAYERGLSPDQEYIRTRESCEAIYIVFVAQTVAESSGDLDASKVAQTREFCHTMASISSAAAHLRSSGKPLSAVIGEYVLPLKKIDKVSGDYAEKVVIDAYKIGWDRNNAYTKVRGRCIKDYTSQSGVGG